MAKLYNLAAMTVASTGTGTITLGSAATINGVLYLSFAAAGVSNGEVVAYSINDVGGSEVGTGTYTAAGTTLSRTPVTSTNSNNAINMTAAAIVKISPAKEDIANLRQSNTFTDTTGQIIQGPLDISAGTAGQIIFPATQNASSNANTLDDYEKGTWTPVLTFATPGDLSVSYSIQQAWYEKIGRTVIAHCALQTSAFTFTTASGNVQVTGLPFTATSPVGTNAQRSGGIQWQGITKANYTDMVPAAESASTIITIRAAGSGQTGANVTAADMPTGGSVIFRFASVYSAST